MVGNMATTGGMNWGGKIVSLWGWRDPHQPMMMWISWLQKGVDCNELKPEWAKNHAGIQHFSNLQMYIEHARLRNLLLVLQLLYFEKQQLHACVVQPCFLLNWWLASCYRSKMCRSKALRQLPQRNPRLLHPYPRFSAGFLPSSRTRALTSGVQRASGQLRPTIRLACLCVHRNCIKDLNPHTWLGEWPCSMPTRCA